MSFPISFKDISRFERLNGISVNVYGYDKSYIYPLKITDANRDRHVSSLNIEDCHYCWIKDLYRPVRSKLTKDRAYDLYLREVLDLLLFGGKAGGSRAGLLRCGQDPDVNEN